MPAKVTIGRPLSMRLVCERIEPPVRVHLKIVQKEFQGIPDVAILSGGDESYDGTGYVVSGKTGLLAKTGRFVATEATFDYGGVLGRVQVRFAPDQAFEFDFVEPDREAPAPKIERLELLDGASLAS